MKGKKIWFLQIESIYSTKDHIKRMKEKSEKIFANHILDQELVSRIYKELSKPNC